MELGAVKLRRATTMAEQVERKLHAVMISAPYQGHINPMANLALKLASKGITVTFILFQHIHHKLSQVHGGATDLFADARRAGLDIRYETVSDGFSLDFNRELCFKEYIEGTIREFPRRVDELVKRKITEFDDSDSRWVSFLVYDTVHFGCPDVAKKHGILNVSLWTEPALVFSLIYHLELLRQNGHFPCKDGAEEEMTYIPGIRSMNTRDLMSFLRESQASGIIASLLLKAFEQVGKADFVLHNTVEELEPQVLSGLNLRQQNYAIGPLNSFENLISSTPLNKSLWPESDCTDWLKSKPPNSVLYVSFGSFVHSSKEMIDEIAHGLLLSEVSFIWVLRTGILNNGDSYSLPEEMGTMKEKGMIIPWCNQMRVLSDQAVGGFLTHNGWNSTIESMWFGVPMLCFPFESDQVTNRKLVVQDWKIGMNLCDGKTLDRREVAAKIKRLFADDQVRSRAKQVKETMQAACDAGGSSHSNFDQFIQGLMLKCLSTVSY